MARNQRSVGSYQPGFTIVEIIVALVVGTLVIGITWQMFSAIMGKPGGPSGAVALTAESFLRQEGIDGVQMMTRRLQEAIQIIQPRPGQTASTLVFRDVLNEEITVQVENKTLVSQGPRGIEKAPVELKTVSGYVFLATKPVHVAGCTAAQFTTISPGCVAMSLTFEGEGGSTSLLNTVQLHNPNLAR